MSQDIIKEVTFFSHSVVMGLAITFFYDWFLICRKLIRHSRLLVSLEDLIFWITCGIGVFYMLYRENNGILRWFAVVGAVLGMCFYKAVIKKSFVNIMSTCIYKIMCFIFRILQVVLKPVKWLFLAVRRCVRCAVKKSEICQKYVKKKLTVCIKMLKMVLCKH